MAQNPPPFTTSLPAAPAPRRYRHFQTLAGVLIALFVIEALVMAIINWLALPSFVEAILDASALITIAIPVLYLLVARPMYQSYQAEVAAREAAEHARQAAETARQAAETARLEAENARRTAETLRATSMEMAATLELSQVMDVLLNRVVEIAPFDYATLYLYNPQAPHMLCARAARGYPREICVEPNLLCGFDPSENPVLESVIDQRQGQVVEDVHATPGWTYRTGEEHARSWMGLPLITGSRVIGLLGLGALEPQRFTTDHLRHAEGVVSQAAVAIQNAWLFEQVRTSGERLQRLTHQMVEVQENERRFVARELHDGVGQTLISALMHTRLIDQRAGDLEAVRAGAALLDQELSEVSENLHDLAVTLRPASLDRLGLESTIRQYLEGLEERHRLKIQFEVAGLTIRLPEAMETVLYRIVQEALINVIRHARASQVDVLLQVRKTHLVLIVEDNGVGFDAEQVGSSLGLLGIRERAEMLGGTLTIESALGKGTTLFVEVPLE